MYHRLLLGDDMLEYIDRVLENDKPIKKHYKQEDVFQKYIFLHIAISFLHW